MSKKTKKTGKKSPIKVTAPKVTIDSLREAQSVMGAGAMETACITYLMANLNKPFTSYEIHTVVGGNTAKSVRDFFRSLGLKKAMVSSNNGVIRYNETKYAILMGKQGARVTYEMRKVS